LTVGRRARLCRSVEITRFTVTGTGCAVTLVSGAIALLSRLVTRLGRQVPSVGLEGIIPRADLVLKRRRQRLARCRRRTSIRPAQTDNLGLKLVQILPLFADSIGRQPC
jgi:hypothetical protein